MTIVTYIIFICQKKKREMSCWVTSRYSVFSESPFCQERHAPLLASGFLLTGNDKSTSLQSTVFWINVSLRRETPVSKEFSTWVNKTSILPLQWEGPTVRGWCCKVTFHAHLAVGPGVLLSEVSCVCLWLVFFFFLHQLWFSQTLLPSEISVILFSLPIVSSLAILDGVSPSSPTNEWMNYFEFVSSLNSLL